MNPIRKQRLACVALLALCACVAAGLIVFALGENINHFHTPSQIRQGEVARHRMIRGGGVVVQGSIKRDPNTLKVLFQMGDGDAFVDVVYDGILPDLFAEDSGIVATGKLNDDGVFVATELLARHDPRYIPREVQLAIEGVHKKKKAEATGF